MVVLLRLFLTHGQCDVRPTTVLSSSTASWPFGFMGVDRRVYGDFPNDMYRHMNIRIQTFPLVSLDYIFSGQKETHLGRYVKAITFQGAKRHIQPFPLLGVSDALRGISPIADKMCELFIRSF